MSFAPHTMAMVWPRNQLVPSNAVSVVAPFSRSGGPSLTNLNPAVRTDRGKWMIELGNVGLFRKDQRRTWDAIETYLSGRAGLIAVPVWSFDVNPFVEGDGRWAEGETTFSDGSTFSDGTTFAQHQIAAKMHSVANLSATTVQINAIHAEQDMTGVRFSYQHAAYKTGRAISVSGTVWTVEITPAIRMPIPAGAELNFDTPTCLCRLKEDSSMRRGIDTLGHDRVTVAFEEATDYWSNLALDLI
jgi:hypothetical protein